MFVNTHRPTEIDGYGHMVDIIVRQLFHVIRLELFANWKERGSGGVDMDNIINGGHGRHLLLLN